MKYKNNLVGKKDNQKAKVGVIIDTCKAKSRTQRSMRGGKKMVVIVKFGTLMGGEWRTNHSLDVFPTVM